MCFKINGARDVADVWADTQQVIDKVEVAFAGAAQAGAEGGSLRAHVYASAEDAPVDLASKLASAAEKRFGAGKVSVSGRAMSVEGSMKAFDLDALRAFD